MTSFLEKLKKGMGVEEMNQEEKPPVVLASTNAAVKKTNKAPKKRKTKASPTVKVQEAAEVSEPKVKTPKKETWPEPEGQLAVDVYQTDNDLVVQSAIAGIKPDLIDINIEDDVITIKGERQKLSQEEGDYFYQECYWGPFSRQIISPVEIDSGRVDASLKDGILTIRVPKIMKQKKAKIVIKS